VAALIVQFLTFTGTFAPKLSKA